MRQRQVLVAMAGTAVVWGAGVLAVAGQPRAWAAPGASGKVQAVGSWGKAVEVPGLGALNKGGKAAVNSVSCGAVGECAAVGSYTDSHAHQQGFVSSEVHGKW